MGNQKSQFEQRFSNNYGFIEALQDPIYGFVKVYRKKFQNYHYVMVIDRRLEEFNNHTFMTSCIRPDRNSHTSLQKHSKSNVIPRLLAKDTGNYSQEYNSMKLQKLKQTLQLIKRYQDQLMVPFFSYRVIEGSKFQCIQPVIQLYVEYQNHRLLEYLEVLRSKSLSLKVKEIIYILKTVCMAINQLQRMEIQVTSKQVNVHNIFTSNEGEIKLHPIEIITKKEHERQNMANIENLKSQSSTNPSIEAKRIGRNFRASGSTIQKSSDQVNPKLIYLKQRGILLSSNQSFSTYPSQLNSHKEILQKLLIQLSAYSHLKSSENKELQGLNAIINKSSSLTEIQRNIEKYGNPCIQGLLVQRIYDLDQTENKNKYKNSNVSHHDKLSTSSMSNVRSSLNGDNIKNQVFGNNDPFSIPKLQNANNMSTKIKQDPKAINKSNSKLQQVKKEVPNQRSPSIKANEQLGPNSGTRPNYQSQYQHEIISKMSQVSQISNISHVIVQGPNKSNQNFSQTQPQRNNNLIISNPGRRQSVTKKENYQHSASIINLQSNRQQGNINNTKENNMAFNNQIRNQHPQLYQNEASNSTRNMKNYQ